MDGAPNIGGPAPGMLTPSPAASPSANLGDQAHAAGTVKQALRMLEMALPKLPIESPLHAAVRTSINALAKHITSAAGEDQALQASMLKDLALRTQQMHPMLAALQARGAPGAPPGPPGPPAGGPPALPGA